MVRLTGYRPSHVRRYLGWEWLLEAWLRQEADTGGLAPELTVELLSSAGEADVRFRNRSRTAIRTREERRRREVVG
jgi:hypothetical protein